MILTMLAMAVAIATEAPLRPDDGWSRGPMAHSAPQNSPTTRERGQGRHPCDVLSPSKIREAIGFVVTSAQRISPGYGSRKCLFTTPDTSRYVIVEFQVYDNEIQAEHALRDTTDGMARSTNATMGSVEGLGRQARSVGTAVVQRIDRTVITFDYENPDSHGSQGTADVARFLQPYLTHVP